MSAIVPPNDDDDAAPSAAPPTAPPRPRLAAPARIVVLLTTYVLSAIIAVYVVIQLVIQRAERHTIAITTAGLAVAFSVPLSAWDVNKHVQEFVSPLQRHYVRILLMVPVYAVESWLALTFKDQRVYLELLREAYEAWVIYTIHKLFIEFLGERVGVELSLSRHARDAGNVDERVPFLFPFCRLRGWRRREEFQFRTNALVFQYVFLRSVLAVAELISEAKGTLCVGSIDFGHCLFPWATLILTCSQCAAMYGLIFFYSELSAELAPIRALSKLLVVKAVVFFSFWQGAAVNLCEWMGYFRETEFYSSSEINGGFQNFLICWEMVLAAIAHHFVFHHGEIVNLASSQTQPTMPVFEQRVSTVAAVSMLLPQDALIDAQSHIITAAGQSATQAIRAVRAATGVLSPERNEENDSLM